MKKLLPFLFLGIFFISCSVDQDELQPDVDGVASLQAEISATDDCAYLEEDVYVELCATEISNPTVRGFQSYFKAQVQLHTELPLTGSFEPSAEELLALYYENNGMGIFAASYTVETESCGTINIEVAVEVKDCTVAEPCSLFAQDQYSRIYSEAEILELIDGNIMNLKPLWLDLLEEDAPKNGGFVDSKIIDLYNFYRAQKKAGSTSIDLTYNYTAQVGDCIDSVDLTLTVCLQNCPVAEPPCELINQDNYEGFYTEAEVLTFIDGNIMNLKWLWLSLLEDDAPKTGRFNNSKIIEQYNYYRSQKKLGHTTISLTYPYSVTVGECEDSANLKLTISE